MSFRATFATARRVLNQLRRDPRTIALMLLVPVVLVFLLEQLFADNRVVFQRIGGPLLGLFPLIAMFLVTSITMLRERVSGTRERLMAQIGLSLEQANEAIAAQKRIEITPQEVEA